MTTEHEPPDVHASPSGKYTLNIASRATKPGCWNHTRGTVLLGDQEIAAVDRNYSSFPFCWIEGHPDGHDYLLCGANYQGQTLIRLDTGERWDYLPPEAYEGFGFCFAAMTPSPDGRTLAVEGCYWGASYEVRMYDFTEPRLPLLLLGEHEGANETVKEWTSPTECVVGRMVDQRISDGADVDFMTVAECEADGLFAPDGDYDPAKVRNVFVGSTWSRPSYASAAKIAEATLRHRRKHGVPLHVEWVDGYERALTLAGEGSPYLAECRAAQVTHEEYMAHLRAKAEKRKAAVAADKEKTT